MTRAGGEEAKSGSVGEDIILPQKQSQTEINRSVEINGESLHQSLPQWGKGDHEVVDEVFLTPNRSQSVRRKCYNEWYGSSGRRPLPMLRGKPKKIPKPR